MGRRTGKLIFDRDFREEQLSKFKFIEPTPSNCEKYYKDHLDFVYILLYKRLSERFFDKYQFEKLADTIDAYAAAYEEGLISAENLCKKLNKEIIETWLCPRKEFKKISSNGVIDDNY